MALLSSPLNVVAALIVLALLVCAIVVPGISGETAREINTEMMFSPPSWDFPFGTDRLGRNTFLRVLVATRLSLALASGAAAIGALLGFTAGGIMALSSGRLRDLLTRLVDVLIAFPAILMAIIIGTIIGPSTESAVIAIGIAIAPNFARLSHTTMAAVVGRDYVAAARAVGVSPPRLFLRYMFANVAEPLLIAGSVAITSSLIHVSALSFLGLGVQAPAIDWGRMLAEGLPHLYGYPWLTVAPGLTIVVAGLAINTLGEAAARASNPASWVASPRPKVDDATDASSAHVGGRRARIGASSGRDSRKSESGKSMDPGDRILRVEDLSVFYDTPDGPVNAVRGISFEIGANEIVGIVGESGSGKSSLAMALARLVEEPGRTEASRLEFSGQDIMTLPKGRLRRLLGMKLGLVYQDPLSSLNPALRIETQLTEGVRTHADLSKRDAHARALQRLRDVHMPAPEHRLRQYPHELSGGMRQRTVIAMTLMTEEPTLIIADEPTTSLDVTVQAQILELLKAVSAKSTAGMILISHDVGVVSEICTRVIVMYAGLIVEDGPVRDVLETPRHPYTRALMDAIPSRKLEPKSELRTIPGRPPELGSIPIGCSFAGRCLFVIDKCLSESPELSLRTTGVLVACWVDTENGNLDTPLTDHET